MHIHGLALLLTTLLLAPLPVEQVPTGNWKMTIQVGHVGEGLRTVILEVTENSDGSHAGRLTSMQNRMTDADEVSYKDDTLTVWYGSYEYVLQIDGDSASGTVTSPTGTQDVSAKRQETQLFAGDAPEPYQKTWNGALEKRDNGYAIVTRRNTFYFTNPDAFAEQLTNLTDKDASITGLWRIDKIEILTVEPWEGRRR